MELIALIANDPAISPDLRKILMAEPVRLAISLEYVRSLAAELKAQREPEADVNPDIEAREEWEHTRRMPRDTGGRY